MAMRKRRSQNREDVVNTESEPTPKATRKKAAKKKTKSSRPATAKKTAGESPVTAAEPVVTTYTVSSKLPEPTAGGPPAGAPQIQVALDIARNHALMAGAVGLVPSPALDIVAVGAVQLKMVQALAGHYDVPFRPEIARALIASLVATVCPVNLAWGLAGSLCKALPGLGSLLGAGMVPAFAGSLTYAMGRLFIQHFESGGVLLDFDPIAARTRFRVLVEEEEQARD